jgi:hypothetical protein
MEELQVVIKSLLRTTQHGRMNLSQLERDYKQQIGEDLKAAACRVGSKSIQEMLRSLSDVEITGEGFQMTVQCKDLDHIANMNRSKR